MTTMWTVTYVHGEYLRGMDGRIVLFPTKEAAIRWKDEQGWVENPSYLGLVEVEIKNKE